MKIQMQSILSVFVSCKIVTSLGISIVYIYICIDSTMVAGDLPVVISCASLALADAGIMMYDLVAAVSVVSFASIG